MLRIRTLGGLSVSREGQPLAGHAAQPRRLAVLALVARAGDRGMKRERLLSLIWPDSTEEAGRASLSQAIHILRRDAGSDDLFLGVQDLRLNQAFATCDVTEFESALGSSDLERAVGSYTGPFLEGFRVSGAEELDRWIEEERASLALKHAESLERLARSEMEKGNAVGAVSWWRRRAALDPLNARVTVELMKALDAAGERAAAIKQARIYDALLQQELGIDPDAAVLRLAEELKSGARGARRETQESGLETQDAIREKLESIETKSETAPGEPEPVQRVRRPASRVRAWQLSAALLIAVATLIFILRPNTQPSADPLLAVGTIRDYRADAANVAGPISDMLATNLARVPGVQVLSTLRMLELVHRQRGLDTVAAVAAAAREAGATELLEGGIHGLGGDRIVLEIRRVDLATGSVRSASRLEGNDLFELVTAATREISASLGHPGGSLDPGEVSTRSLVAWRLYEEGLRQFARGDYRNAMELFGSAVREDSSFAMAEFYRMWSVTGVGQTPTPAEAENLDRLASRATERERLIIRIWLAAFTQAPGILAIAESLAARYPMEIDGHYHLGAARMIRSEYQAAIPHLRRALALDSTSLGSRSPRCVACLALSHIGFALHAVDSLPRAIASARAWIERDSSSSIAWRELARVLLVSGRYDEAVDTWKRAPNDLEGYSEVFPASAHIYSGQFARADERLRSAMRHGSTADRFEARWYLAISLRHQGRWEESARLMRERVDALTPEERAGDHDFLAMLAEALAWYESGRVREAMARWDSIARTPRPILRRGDLHRRQSYLYTLLTDGAHTLGDTARVARYADSAAAWGSRSDNPRDHHITRHARGIALLVRGDTTAAIAMLRSAVFSPTTGFTRTNVALARLLTASGRPAEAVEILRPALHGPLEAANLYITRTEVQEEMAQAFSALGSQDSARVYFGTVASALANSDPPGRRRLEAARQVIRSPSLRSGSR